MRRSKEDSVNWYLCSGVQVKHGIEFIIYPNVHNKGFHDK